MKNTTRLNALGRGQNILLLYWKTAFATALCALACSQLGLAQIPPASILQIDVANNVLYLQDTSDVSKFATDPKATTVAGHGSNNFNLAIGIADIVAVNGQPVKGTHIRSAQNFFSSTAPAPGGAIADTVRDAAGHVHFRNLEERRHTDRDHCDERIRWWPCAARSSIRLQREEIISQ